MISSLTGTVAAVGLDHAVLDVGGVGFACQAAPSTLAGLRTGSDATLQTVLVVREDSLTLYGFTDRDEREVFLTVQTVGGVGPKLALAIIAVLTPEELRQAVSNDDLAALQKVPGIGKKVAQRLVLELSGKLGEPAGTAPAAPAGAVDPDVVAALVQLGWNEKNAVAAVHAVAERASGRAEVLRFALQHLAAGRG